MKQKHVAANQVGIPESDYLYIKESQLPASGRGLYTAVTLYKDEEITVFKGDVISEKQITKRISEGEDKYFISLLNGRILDCMHTECFAKYANDAVGYASATFTNNAKIIINEQNEVCLMAVKKIKAGEEIFCGYGKRYWKKHLIKEVEI
ncbi:MAG: SET domain-containing protein-lysine N-methyltransferase [Bacteroidota bacterium]